MSDLEALALNATRELSPAELHGAVCGVAACTPEVFPVEDLLSLVGTDAVTDEQSVEAFVRESVELLRADDMSFMPLLPEDELGIGLRLEGLAEWCASFLAGLAVGLSRMGIGSLDELPEEAREIVADLKALTEVDLADPELEDDGNPSPEAEDDLMQLQEFVKVGVLLVANLVNDSGPGAESHEELQ